MADPLDGKTGTVKNPNSPLFGQKVVRRNGTWEPMYSGDKLAPQEQAQLQDARDSARTFDDIAGQAESFIGYNRKAPTGLGYKNVNILGLNVGNPVRAVAAAVNPNVASMEALTARMAPQQREPGSGTTSDRDLSLFLQAVPSVDRMGTANEAIAKDMRAMAGKRQQRAYFFDRYAQQNGTLRGAPEAFDRYWITQQAKAKQQPAQRPPQRAQPAGKPRAAPIMTIDIDGNPVR